MKDISKKAANRRRGQGNVTLDDVAQAAGVSAITVSRTMSSPHLVAASTRKKVRRAIDELGYIRNHVAGSLASTRSRTVASIVPTLGNSIFTEMLDGMVAALRSQSYQLILGNSNYDLQEEEDLVKAFLGRRVEGLVLTGGVHTPRTRKAILGSGVPVVETWSLPDAPLMMSVGFSNYRAAFEMTRSLWDWGYRRLAFVSAPTESNDRASERRRGFSSALESLGLVPPRDAMIVSSFGLARGAAALARILETRPDTDAVFFANDTLAAGALFETRRRGLAVPGDIAIAGFDDQEIAEQCIPSLTTVRVPRYELGRRSAQLILDTIDLGEPRTETVDLGFEVIRRRSA